MQEGLSNAKRKIGCSMIPIPPLSPVILAISLDEVNVRKGQGHALKLLSLQVVTNERMDAHAFRTS